jgi:hypothetical protein
MRLTVEFVYFCAIAVLSLGLLMWFILRFVPSVLNLKGEDGDKF